MANNNVIPIQYDNPDDLDFSKVVYVDTTNPSTATIFDLNSPPTVNDPALKEDSANVYVGTNGQTYTYNTSTSTYNTYIYPIDSPYLVTMYRNSNDSLLGSFAISSNKYNLIDTNTTTPNAFSSANTSTFTITPTRAGYYDVTVAYSVYRGPSVDVTIFINKNNNSVATVSMFGGNELQVKKIVYMNGTTDFLTGTNRGAVANASRPQNIVNSFMQVRWLHS